MNSCKYFRLRHKQGRSYYYCTLKSRVIGNECSSCSFIEYRTRNTLKKTTYKHSKADKERYSIIYHDLTKCAFDNSKTSIEKNEVFEGSYRQTSIRLGMVIPLCKTHHDLFHNDRYFALSVKNEFQKAYIKNHSYDEFIKEFKIDYHYLFEEYKKMLKQQKKTRN